MKTLSAGVIRYPEIDWNLCACCDPCAASKVCRTHAIVRFDRDEPVLIELSRCNGCGVCVLECPYDAIIMNNK